MKRMGLYVIGTAIVLAVPLVAMQFTSEVDWSAADFIIAGMLLLGAGVLYEFAASKVPRKNRSIVAAIFATAVLLIWAEMAVGIFGTPLAGN